MLNPEWQTGISVMGGNTATMEQLVNTQEGPLPFANDSLEQVQALALDENFTAIRDPMSNTYALMHAHPDMINAEMAYKQAKADARRARLGQKENSSSTLYSRDLATPRYGYHSGFGIDHPTKPSIVNAFSGAASRVGRGGGPGGGGSGSGGPGGGGGGGGRGGGGGGGPSVGGNGLGSSHDHGARAANQERLPGTAFEQGGNPYAGLPYDATNADHYSTGATADGLWERMHGKTASMKDTRRVSGLQGEFERGMYTAEAAKEENRRRRRKGASSTELSLQEHNSGEALDKYRKRLVSVREEIENIRAEHVKAKRSDMREYNRTRMGEGGLTNNHDEYTGAIDINSAGLGNSGTGGQQQRSRILSNPEKRRSEMEAEDFDAGSRRQVRVKKGHTRGKTYNIYTPPKKKKE